MLRLIHGIISAFFELFLPPVAAKRAVPFLGFVAGVGFPLLVL